jgi:hypothetical protein
MTTMTTTTIMAIRTMTSAQEPATMHVHFETVPLRAADAFQYSWFHIIFVLGAMYVAMLLTDWYDSFHFFTLGY